MVHVATSQSPVERHSIDPLLASYPLLQLTFAVDSNVVVVKLTVPLATVMLEPQSVCENNKVKIEIIV